MRGIFRTLEKNTYLTEKRKIDWLDRALQYEDKASKRELDQLQEHQRRLDDIRKQNYYREAVKKRSLDLVEEKKNKALWRLEKIEVKQSLSKERG